MHDQGLMLENVALIKQVKLADMSDTIHKEVENQALNMQRYRENYTYAPSTLESIPLTPWKEQLTQFPRINLLHHGSSVQLHPRFCQTPLVLDFHIF